ncbi:hypothetical protein ACFL59_16110, partial [Planctomycetota bacterium]
MAQAWSRQDVEKLARRLNKLAGDPREPDAASTGAVEDAEVEARLSMLEDRCREPEPILDDLDALLGLDELKEAAATRLAPADVGYALNRIVNAYDSIESDALRQAVQDHLLGFFDRCVRHMVLAKRVDKIESFVFRFISVLRGTEVLRAHPLGRMLREVERGIKKTREALAEEGPEEGKEEVAPHLLTAEEIVRKLLSRSDVATTIATTRALGITQEQKAISFGACVHDRLLSLNVDLLSRFEQAIRLPDKAMRFDRRFQILGTIFGDSLDDETGTDSFGKFSWVLGLDVAAEVAEGYEGELFILDELEYATPLIGAGTAEAGAEGESFLELPSVDMGAKLKGLEGAVGPEKPVTEIGGTWRKLDFAADLGSVGQTLPSVGALFAGRMLELPRSAVASLQLGDMAEFERVVASQLPRPVVASVIRTMQQAMHSRPGMQKVPSGLVPGMDAALDFQSDSMARFTGLERRMRKHGLESSALGSLDHLAIGYQELSKDTQRRSAAQTIGELTVGAGGSGLGYVASSSPTFVAASTQRLAGMGQLERLPGMSPIAGSALDGLVGPATRRAMTLPALGGAPITMGHGVPREAVLDAQTLRGAAASGLGALLRTKLAAPRGAEATTAGSVPTFAIATDGFGVPRYRGGHTVSRQALSHLEGFDLTGTLVVGGGQAEAQSRMGTGTTVSGAGAQLP